MIQKRGFYMNVKIGKHIKELRNRDGVTQDALAEALGVTGQAISKWENESGYPDIEYITPIANFFNVTIDQLFGHDRSESENKINEYCEKLDGLHRNWADVNTRIDLARQALAEFPAEEKLLVRLATALWEKWSDDASDECFIFVDGKIVGASVGHFRNGPYDVSDVVCVMDNADERKQEIMDAVSAVNFGKKPIRFNGKEI
jgi:transcriptional regulator with XRE-family HTH domain